MLEGSGNKNSLKGAVFSELDYAETTQNDLATLAKQACHSS